jgi:hypothetical protein
MKIYTKIPKVEIDHILQNESSGDIIIETLNKLERLYYSDPVHKNQKRIYPFWKICQHCNNPFMASTKEQAIRNKTCSRKCAGNLTSIAKKGIKIQGKIKCKKCLVLFYPTYQSKNRPRIYCSWVCAGKSKDWLKNYSNNGLGKKNPKKGSKLEKNYFWKGGITYMKRKGKYSFQPIKYIKCPIEYIEMSRKDGYVMEHRLKVAIELKRPLTRDECVHHINHDATDNRIENLMLFKNNSDHKRYENGANIEPLWTPQNVEIMVIKYSDKESDVNYNLF